jgi:8-oxo-dGTP pyrophosphatase MutT (NUDIX family)
VPEAAESSHLRCAAALIVDGQGRIFVQRRSPHRRLFPNAWDVVGGHLEPGETTLEALRREIHEETGWHLATIVAELDPVTYTGDDGLTRVEEDFLVRVDGDLDNPRLEPDKHTGYRWIGADDVAGLFDPDHPTAADGLIRALLTTGFALARRSGLIT